MVLGRGSLLLEAYGPWTDHFHSAVFSSSIKGHDNVLLTGKCED